MPHLRYSIEGFYCMPQLHSMVAAIEGFYCTPQLHSPMVTAIENATTNGDRYRGVLTPLTRWYVEFAQVAVHVCPLEHPGGVLLVEDSPEHHQGPKHT